MNARQLLRTLACTCAIVILPGCDRLTLLLDSDLEISYLGEEFGHVQRASVSTRTRVIASARRVGIRRTGNPVVTEVDVDETHFVRGTLDVVYTGRVVFQCSARQEVRPRIRVAPGVRHETAGRVSCTGSRS